MLKRGNPSRSRSHLKLVADHPPMAARTPAITTRAIARIRNVFRTPAALPIPREPEPFVVPPRPEEVAERSEDLHELATLTASSFPPPRENTGREAFASKAPVPFGSRPPPPMSWSAEPPPVAIPRPPAVPKMRAAMSSRSSTPPVVAHVDEPAPKAAHPAKRNNRLLMKRLGGVALMAGIGVFVGAFAQHRPEEIPAEEQGFAEGATNLAGQASLGPVREGKVVTSDPKVDETLAPPADPEILDAGLPDATIPQIDSGAGPHSEESPKALRALQAAPPINAPPAKVSGAPLSRSAMESAMSRAASAARGCASGGADRASVNVTFSPSGSVSAVSVDGVSGPGQSCVSRAFRNARVPAFEGSPFSVHKTVRF